MWPQNQNENYMKLHKKKKHEIPKVDANDTISGYIIEDEHIEKSSNQNAANAGDVLMALNLLGSCVKYVKDQIKLIIKWSNNYLIFNHVFQLMLSPPSIYRWEE